MQLYTLFGDITKTILSPTWYKLAHNLWKHYSGFAGQIGFKLIASFIGILPTLWINVNFDPVERSHFAIITSITGLTLAFIGLGIPDIIQRSYTLNEYQSQRSDIWTTLWYIRIAGFLIMAIVTGLIGILFPYLNVWFLIGVFSAQYILLCDQSFRAICDSVGRSWQFSLTDVGYKTFLVVILFTIAHLLPSEDAQLLYVVALLTAYTIGIVLDYLWQKSYISWGKLNWHILRKITPTLLTLGLASLVVGLYQRTAPLFLSGFDPDIINGYDNAYKLFETWMLIPTLLGPVLASSAMKRFEINNSTHEIQKDIKWQWLIGLALVIISILSSPIALWILGASRYPLSFTIFPLFGGALLLLPAIMYIHTILIQLHYEKFVFISTGINAIIGVTLLIVLIPIFDGYGAALAIALTSICDFSIKYILLKKALSKRNT